MSQNHPLRSSVRPDRRETWTRLDAGVYRGVRHGRALGEIHTVVGGYVAVDPTDTPVGRYARKDRARNALRKAAAGHAPRPDGARAALGRTAATVVGGVALAGALTAAAAAPWL